MGSREPHPSVPCETRDIEACAPQVSLDCAMVEEPHAMNLAAAAKEPAHFAKRGDPPHQESPALLDFAQHRPVLAFAPSANRSARRLTRPQGVEDQESAGGQCAMDPCEEACERFRLRRRIE